MGLWEFIGTAGETFGGDWEDYTLIDFNNDTYDPNNRNPNHVASSPGLNDVAKDWALGAATLPGICDPTVAAYQEPHRNDDNNGATPATDDMNNTTYAPGPDGTADPRRTWNWNFNRMAFCIYAIDQSGASSIVFDKATIDTTPVADGGLYDIEFSPRFAWVPESWRDMTTYLTGGAKPFEIKRFRPLFVSDLIYPQNANNMCLFRAGETGTGGNNGFRFPNPAAGNPNPCTNNTAFNSLNALLFDVEFGNDQPTMLPQEVLDKEPALKKKPQPSLIR
jgi:hypothetical protein